MLVFNAELLDFLLLTLLRGQNLFYDCAFRGRPHLVR